MSALPTAAGQCPVPFAAAGQNTKPAAINQSGWVLRIRRILCELLGRTLSAAGWGRLRIRFALPQTPTEVCLLPTRAGRVSVQKDPPAKKESGS